MTPGAGPAFEQAMDELLLKVDYDNVLDVHRAFRKHADQLHAYLMEVETTTTLGLCGLDPVSHEVLKADSLAGKVRSLFEVHHRHREELEAVAARLLETARLYGRTEEDIERALKAEAADR